MKLGLYEMDSHESNEGERPECFFLICFPCGDVKKLAVAEAQDFDVPDYNLASRYYFHTEKAAGAYAHALARQYGLDYEGGGMLLD